MSRIWIAIARTVIHVATRVRRRPACGDRQRVRYLLAHAWGTGGTVRTTFTVAGSLTGELDVEVLSLVRLRERPGIVPPAGVRVRALDDQRPREGQGLVERWARRRASLLVSHRDGLSERCSLWTDLQVVRAFAGRPADVLVATRPSLIVLVARLRPPGTMLVGQEHLNLESRRAAGKPLSLAACERLDALVTLTEEDREAYAAVLPGQRVVAIPNAVDRVPPVPPAQREPIVLGVGRLRRQKGFDRLIAAFAIVAPDFPQWRLRIVGEGKDRAPLAEQVRELGLDGRIALVGRTNRMAHEYARASVLALTSRFEGFPMVLLEAMAHGLPVVSMRCPTGPASLIDTGVNGLLTRRDDPEDLARALRELMTDTALRRRLADAAWAGLRPFEVDAVAARWRLLFEELTVGTGRGDGGVRPRRAAREGSPGRRRARGPAPRPA